MNIEFPTHESIQTREEILLAFQQSRERIIQALNATIDDEKSINPFGTNPQTPERKEAEKMLVEWRKQAETISAWQNDDLRHRVNLQQIMIYVDAGFHDFEYLNDVLEELKIDSDNIEKMANNSIRVKTRQQMKDAELKIKQILAGRTPTETDYDISDIDLNQETEPVPTINLLQEIEDANKRALSENPDYKKSSDNGVGLVWKHMSDSAKIVWNSQVWNKRLLTDPEGLLKWTEVYPDRKIREVPITTIKVKIDQPK